MIMKVQKGNATTSHYWLLILFGFYIQQIVTVKILTINPILSRSHFSVNQRIFKALAARGHELTVMSGFPEENPPSNYTDINIKKDLTSFIDAMDLDDRSLTGGMFTLKRLMYVEKTACENIFDYENIKKAVKSAPKKKTYDLIIAEIYQIPCYLSLAVKLDIPIIWIIAASSNFAIDYYIGNPNNPSYVSLVTAGLTENMSFFEKLYNIYEYIAYYVFQTFYFDPESLDIFHKKFPDVKKLSMDDVFKKASIAFVHNHITILNRPNLPNIIEIGGIHIEEEKPIRQDILGFIESAEYGVIYFSFGSTLKCSSMTRSKLELFRNVFSRIKQKVLWRCDKLNLINVTENVMISQWLPQRDILAHKNVKAFISHGGMLGTYEAIYTAMPVIGIPFMFDQHTDIRTLEHKGAAIYLDYEILTEQLLIDAIDQIINQTSYKTNMNKLSNIFRDRPISPLDAAIYWTEYVIRHNEAGNLLRARSADMPLYQYLLLDVIAFLIFVTILIAYIAIYVFQKFISIIRTIYVNKLHKKML